MPREVRMDAIPSLDTYELSDRYDREEGRVFLTGTQAIVRIALDQARRDRAAGLNTAGFISGYRGSPLGGIDLELWRIPERLKRDAIEFLPAVNEDLAATAVLGSQQVETQADREVDGVCTARAPASTAPAMRSSTAMPTAPRRMAACWWSPATTMAASRPRCRTSPTSPS